MYTGFGWNTVKYLHSSS